MKATTKARFKKLDQIKAELQAAWDRRDPGAAPVAEPVFEIGFGWLVDKKIYPIGTKLYAAPPIPKQPEPVVLTHKDIIRMAREAGWPADVLHPHGPGVDTSGYLLVPALERFAALVRADVVTSAKNLEKQAEPVQGLLRDALEHLRHLPWEIETADIEFTDEDLVLLSDALEAQIRAYGTEAAQTAHEEDQGALLRHAQALEALKGKVDDTLAGTYAVISRVRILF